MNDKKHTNKDKHTFSIRIYNTWIEYLKTLAEEQDRSVNYLVEQALKKEYKLSGDSA